MMRGAILTAERIQCAKRGVLNAHPGLLPLSRGVVVIPASILSGVTLHFIDEGIDTGDVIGRYYAPVKGERSAKELCEVCDFLCVAAMHRAAITLPSLPT